MTKEADVALAAFGARIAAPRTPAAAADAELRARDGKLWDDIQSFMQRLAEKAKADTGKDWAVTFQKLAFRPKDDASEITVIVRQGVTPRMIARLEAHPGWLSITENQGRYLENCGRTEKEIYAGLADFMFAALETK